MTPSKGARRTYSVANLKAFARSAARYYGHMLHDDGGRFDTVRTDLRRCLRALSDGFHQFHPDLKIERFIHARAAAANAVAELMLLDRARRPSPTPPRSPAASRADLLGPLSGSDSTRGAKARADALGRSPAVHPQLSTSHATSSNAWNAFLGNNASSSEPASRAAALDLVDGYCLWPSNPATDDRASAFDRIDDALNQLRIGLRLSEDLGLLQARQVRFASTELANIGRMVGGWRAHQGLSHAGPKL